MALISRTNDKENCHLTRNVCNILVIRWNVSHIYVNIIFVHFSAVSHITLNEKRIFLFLQVFSLGNIQMLIFYSNLHVYKIALPVFHIILSVIHSQQDELKTYVIACMLSAKISDCEKDTLQTHLIHTMSNESPM